uniref:Uncharacterized protein n=1 Tax=Bursaphelenchus xylophilus TaxID=6326 RepID=A0A1I7RX95_BURXY
MHNALICIRMSDRLMGKVMGSHGLNNRRFHSHISSSLRVRSGRCCLLSALDKLARGNQQFLQLGVHFGHTIVDIGDADFELDHYILVICCRDWFFGILEIRLYRAGMFAQWSVLVLNLIIFMSFLSVISPRCSLTTATPRCSKNQSNGVILALQVLNLIKQLKLRQHEHQNPCTSPKDSICLGMSEIVVLRVAIPRTKITLISSYLFVHSRFRRRFGPRADPYLKSPWPHRLLTIMLTSHTVFLFKLRSLRLFFSTYTASSPQSTDLESNDSQCLKFPADSAD